MATIQELAPAPWRMMLLPASYNGIPYHVEQQSRSSGQRVVLHEYPKRDLPYAEMMGRSAIRYAVTGYLIGPSYHLVKRALIKALESGTGGMLIDPYLPEPLLVVCDRYNVTETRERGGYCTVEMSFIEAGNPGNSIAPTSTGNAVNSAADNAADNAVDATNTTANTAGGPNPFGQQAPLLL